MGVVPVGALGLAVGERIEIVLVATDRMVVIRGDVLRVPSGYRLSSTKS